MAFPPLAALCALPAVRLVGAVRAVPPPVALLPHRVTLGAALQGFSEISGWNFDDSSHNHG